MVLILLSASYTFVQAETVAEDIGCLHGTGRNCLRQGSQPTFPPRRRWFWVVM